MNVECGVRLVAAHDKSMGACCCGRMDHVLFGVPLKFTVALARAPY